MATARGPCLGLSAIVVGAALFDQFVTSGGALQIKSSLPADAKPGWAPEGSPVALHGALSVRGNQVVDEKGAPVQLQGMSLFWSQWMGQFWNADAIDWLVSDWKVSLVRAAMGVEMGGYLENGDKEAANMKAVVEACIEQGIYVIVDWHDHHGNEHFGNSSVFFSAFSKAYGKYPNVLWEVWNEPEDVDWDKDIRPSHKKIVEVIRKHSDSIVILGTDHWSQGVDIAAANAVKGDNLAYTLHFYAFSHKDDLRQKAQKALDSGRALFVTEWGTCDYTGNGTLDLESARIWIDFLTQYNISMANWAVSDKLESCSALKPGANGSGGWQDSELTPSGYFVRSMLRGEDDGQPCRAVEEWGDWPCVRPACAGDGAACIEEQCCQDADQQCFEKDSGWSQCMAECEAGTHDDGSTWSCEVKSKGFEVTTKDFLLAWAIGATAVATCAIVYALLERKRRRDLEGDDEEEEGLASD